MRNTAAEEAFRAIETHLEQLDWLAALSRRAMTDDAGARQLLEAWLNQHLESEAIGQPLKQVRRPDPGPHNLRNDDPAPPGANGLAEGRPSLGVNVRGVRELFLGMTYAVGADVDRRLAALDMVENAVSRTIGLLDVLHHYALGALNGVEHPETVMNLLAELPTGRDLSDLLMGQPGRKPPRLPRITELNPLLECVHELRRATVGAESASEALREATKDILGLTSRIIAVSPVSVCAGQQVTLRADSTNADTQFPNQTPEHYAVFLEPCGQIAEILEWASDHITIVVPLTARSGCVSLARLPSQEVIAHAQLAEASVVERFTACLADHGVGGSGRGSVALDPKLICPVSTCSPGSPRFLQVGHPPEISVFYARDSAGRVVGTTGVEAGTEVTVSWQIRSDVAAPAQVSISGAKNVMGLSSAGSLVLSTVDTRTDQTLTLDAVNACGRVRRKLSIPVFRRIYLSPSPVRLRTDTNAVLTLRSSCPVMDDLVITLVTVSPGLAHPRVDVPANVTIPAGQDNVVVPVNPSALVPIEAYIAGLEQSQPAARVTATADGHQQNTAEVWVEPPLGQAKLAAADPGMVGVHMALLPSGKVLMFAADHNHFGDIDRIDEQVWDPQSDSFQPPIFPYPTHKNLFCAGHCLLPDGRLLVIGGHAIFAGGSAAKQSHTFNPVTLTWTRHAAMQKDRWYPTCVTLADGRALITSGSEAGGPPTIFKGVVRDVEIFDAASGGLTRFNNIHGDICMYPQMFVLPGGLLFFHSRNVSWLFSSGPGTWSPTNGNWSGDIPMQHGSTRSYPGMAACALLPLLPEQGYTPRILMAGGGGARECDLNSTTAATRSAEILDIDVGNRTGIWRSTDAAGSPLQTTTSRFMTDAVLLPDGTVLLVNGAATGKADDSRGPVTMAELFDPASETFRPLASLSVPRMYHGTALLLPDGRVATAGHTREFNNGPLARNRFEVEYVSPPYLFRGPRPLITSVTHTGPSLGYGQSVTIATERARDVTRVALVRSASVTHQLNTDQRYVGLVITQRDTASIIATAPPDPWVAPPGYYLLFVIDSTGVPSRGLSLRVG